MPENETRRTRGFLPRECNRPPLVRSPFHAALHVNLYAREQLASMCADLFYRRDEKRAIVEGIKQIDQTLNRIARLMQTGRITNHA